MKLVLLLLTARMSWMQYRAVTPTAPKPPMRRSTSRPGTVTPMPATMAAASMSNPTDKPPRDVVLMLNRNTIDTSNPLLVNDPMRYHGINPASAIKAAPTRGLENEKSRG